MATKSISNPVQLVQSGIQKIQSPHVIVINGVPVVSSMKVAEHFSKRHGDVLRDIRRITKEVSKEFSQRNFAFTHYLDEQGKKRPLCELTKDGFAITAMGFTGKEAMTMKEAYIAQFNEMEKAPTPPSPKPLPASLRLSTTADPERKELTALVNAWVGCAPIHYAGARSIVNAHFGVKSIDELTVTQVKEAIAFVQGKIADVGRSTQPALPDGRVIPARGTGLTLEALRDELDAEQCRVATWAKQFHARLSEQSGPLYKYVMQSMLGPSVKDSGCIGISVDTPIGALHESAYRGCDSIKNGFAELEQAVRLARFFAKALDR